MGKFLSMQQTAAALIAKNGSAVTVRRAVAGSFDPVSQSEVGGTTQVMQFVAAVFPPSAQTKRDAGSMEIKVSLEAYFALKGQTTHPTVGDIVIVGGSSYTVAWAETLDPAQDGPIYTKAYLVA